MLKMLKMIPHSVRMRARGYVLNPHPKYMTSPWVHAIELMERKLSFNKRVDKTVNVLEKFAVMASRNFRAKKIYTAKMVEFYRKRAANPRRFKFGEPSWADIMEIEDERRAVEQAAEEVRRQEIRDAYEARLVAMSDRELIDYHQRTMAEHRMHYEDYRPWMDFITKIHQKRAALRAAVVDNAQMWVELNAAPRLHNQQRPAQIRRVVARGRFSALDSDSE
jgi:uncharacterized protein YcgL (UPF0745 family)